MPARDFLLPAVIAVPVRGEVVVARQEAKAERASAGQARFPVIDAVLVLAPQRGDHLEGGGVSALEPSLLEVHVLIVAAEPAAEGPERGAVRVPQDARLPDCQRVVEDVTPVGGVPGGTAVRVDVVAEPVVELPDAHAVVQRLERGRVCLLDQPPQVITLVRVPGVKGVQRTKGGRVGPGQLPAGRVDVAGVPGPGVVEYLKRRRVRPRDGRGVVVDDVLGRNPVAAGIGGHGFSSNSSAVVPGHRGTMYSAVPGRRHLAFFGGSFSTFPSSPFTRTRNGLAAALSCRNTPVIRTASPLATANFPAHHTMRDPSLPRSRRYS